MKSMQELLTIMTRLRDPDSGCPWDRQQSFASIVPYTLEEAYEVADAIERGDFLELKDELGDLLFQVVFYARLAEEQQLFAFEEVVEAITAKLIRRHPHVFAAARYRGGEELTEAWELIKAAEREAKGQRGDSSLLAGIPLALPALSRAVKLQKKAARVGFDWGEVEPVMDKINEELAELRAELYKGHGSGHVREEIGDLLFACANLARHLGLDPEGALRGANVKFERRFRRVEAWLAEAGGTLQQASLAQMDALWERAKQEERQADDAEPS
jgi:ATP diphosphatase